MSLEGKQFDIEKAKNEIKILVDKYQRILDSGEIKEYSEEDTKKDFILPFFEVLGWDVTNKLENEVTAEQKISKGRVDYAFRLHEIPKFFVEAKPFRENVDDRKYVDQAINYSWLKGVTWAVLTNFKKIKVFNSEIKASNPALIQFFELECQDFVKNFDKIYLLSKESLDNGFLDEKAEEWGKKLPKKPLDERLLLDLTTFRELLSENILRNNKSKMLKQEELEESVQRIISRLIFIRALEDRQYEEPMLLSILRENQNKSNMTKLNELYRKLDGIYNAKLFAPHLCDDLQIDDYPLRIVIEGLYRSEEQLQNYDFDAMDADILGGIYEQYLSHILKTGKNGLKINDSRAHKKEEGIYYTPKFIVDYIVRTIFDELESKKIDWHKVKVLDPSCGSGSFLIKSYDYFLNKIGKEMEQKVQSENKDLINYDEKLTIIQNNIFGVDLDPMAVEIAQLNLFLKGVEKKHTLPALKDRIKCGNSLISDRDIDFKRAFDWKKEFSEISNEKGFDVIVGNPPYIKLHTLDKKQLDYFYSKFTSATKHFDIYVLFVEKALSLLKENGIIGLILPSKFFNADYGEGLRKLLAEKKCVYKIINFKDYQVFKGAITYTCLLFLRNSQADTFDYYELQTTHPKTDHLVNF
ncbi:MAG: N-6 DNA methylase [Nitrosotalea sp.]